METQAANAPRAPQTAPPSAETSYSFQVTGMSCASCVAHVEKALKAVPGVTEAAVNLATHSARVAASDTVTLPTLATAVSAAGYTLVPPPARQDALRVDLKVEGMSCASCVGSVEKALLAVPGVSAASVNLATRGAQVSLARPVGVETLLAAVEAAGYQAVAPDADAPADAADPAEMEVAALRGALTVAVALGVPLMLLAMGPWHPAWGPVAQLGLAAVVTFGAGARFFRTAAVQAIHGHANMDTLVAVGAGSAFAYSTAQLVGSSSGGHGHLYFETAGMIVALILTGRMMEARARSRASQAIRALAGMLPARVRVRRNGVESEVPIRTLVSGDMVVLRPGERVPVDGVIREGDSEFDEALLTGEPAPVHRSVGGLVTSGTVNLMGGVVFEATRVGADTVLSRIVSLVEQAQASKANVQRLADKVSGVFVPVVMIISALTLLGWRAAGAEWSYALMTAVSVLVIACPCALGLATPTAVMVGTGRAAHLGILIRDARGLERAGAITAVVLDKTGTLTVGQPRVMDVIAAPGVEPATLVAAAAAAETRSGHPLANAVTAHAAAQGLALMEVQDARAHPGKGVTATVTATGEQIVVGIPEFVAQTIGPAPTGMRWDGTGHGTTVVAVGQGGRWLGVLGVRDALREDSAAAVQGLKDAGIKVVLCTGDASGPALEVAAQVGLPPDAVVASASPARKVEVVNQLRGQGHVVGFVGDGINDAPALAAADVGMAVAAGADVARQACDITLLRPSLAAAADAMALSRATLRTIRQNLLWAFAYNAVCIPMAVAGVLAAWGGPMLAAGAMAFSSVSVVLNSLRLRRVALSGHRGVPVLLKPQAPGSGGLA